MIKKEKAEISHCISIQLSTEMKHLWQKPQIYLGTTSNPGLGDFVSFFSADHLKLCQIGRGLLADSHCQIFPDMFELGSSWSSG